MKNKNTNYIIIGLIGLVIIGTIFVVGQSGGQQLQGALLPSYTTTLTLDSVNKDLQALKAKVATLETTALTTKTTLNSLIDGIKVQFLPGTCQALDEMNLSIKSITGQWALLNFSQSVCLQLIGSGIPNKI